MFGAEAAISVLREFFAEMRQWEIAAHLRSGQMLQGLITPGTERTERVRQLVAIFRRYVDGRPERLRLRQHPYGVPPEYDPASEEILRATSKGTGLVVETRRKAIPRHRFVYELVVRKSKWRIRDNRRRLARQGDLVPWDL